MPIAELREYVEAHPHLVSRVPSKTYPGLFVLKYKRRVFYEGLWNEYLEWCRGLVVDADWNVVVKPFRKIYNRFERGTDFDLDQDVWYAEKINGFMCAVTYIPDQPLIISTTGSLDSDYVAMAREMLFLYAPEEKWLEMFKETVKCRVTTMMEICHPTDPHIIPEKAGFYPLAWNTYDEFEEQDLTEGTFCPFFRNAGMFKALGGIRVPYFKGVFSEVVRKAKESRIEGYVVYDRCFNPTKALKIKSPYYLMTKFLARKGANKLLAMLSLPTWKETFEEEFYEIGEEILLKKEWFASLNEQDRISFIRNWFENRMGVKA